MGRIPFGTINGVVLLAAVILAVGILIAAAVAHLHSPPLAQHGPFTCPTIQASAQQMVLTSNQFSFDGKPAPTGSMVAAFAPDHTAVGCITTTVAGDFRLVVNGVNLNRASGTEHYLKDNDPIALEVDTLKVPAANVRIVGDSAGPPPASLIFLPGHPPITLDLVVSVTSSNG